jgi:hypothetical protein
MRRARLLLFDGATPVGFLFTPIYDHRAVFEFPTRSDVAKCSRRTAVQNAAAHVGTAGDGGATTASRSNRRPPRRSRCCRPILIAASISSEQPTVDTRVSDAIRFRSWQAPRNSPN